MQYSRSEEYLVHLLSPQKLQLEVVVEVVVAEVEVVVEPSSITVLDMIILRATTMELVVHRQLVEEISTQEEI